MKLTCLLFLFAASLLAPGCRGSSLSQGELNSIRALLASIPGAGFVHDPCVFSGIVCSNTSDSILHVVEINLSNRGMIGEIQASIGDLQFLVRLDLSANMLAGPIPSTMANLVSLRYLNLGQPQLHRNARNPEPPYDFMCDPKPRPFFSLCLYLQPSIKSNAFTGSFPDFIGAMSNLTYLNLNRNSFEGELPPSWSKLLLLEELHVSYTGITQLPTWIGNLKSLVIISSFKSKLSGSIPSSITSLPNLSWLLLMENQLTGTIPDDIGRLSALTELVLLQNQLSGGIPPSIGSLRRLVALTLYGNLLTGSIPSSLASIQPDPTIQTPGLLFLSLNQNRLSGSIPANLGTLPLVILYLNENMLTGTLPEQLCGLFVGPAFAPPSEAPNAIWLNQNLLSGTIPSCFGRMPNLKALDLSSNNFVGALPSFADAALLRVLRLSDNANLHLSGTSSLPDSLHQFRARALSNSSAWPLACICSGQLQIFELSGTYLNCEIPACFMQLPQLQQLQLSRCSLKGSLPGSFQNMTSLEVFDVSFNSLSGVVSPSVGSLLKLKMLDLSFNSFSMPAQALLLPLQLLPLLSFVSLSSNFFFGQLTTDLFWNINNIIYFPSLSSLRISNNSLTGTLLHVMGALPMLSTVDVSSNRFVGSIPSSFNALSVFLASDNSLSDAAGSFPSFVEPRCDGDCLASCASSFNSSSPLVASCVRSCCDVVQSKHSNIICPEIRFRDNHRKVITLDPSYNGFSSCTCTVGYFGTPPLCQSCLENALCDGSKYLTVKRGHFPSPNHTNVVIINQCRTGSLGETSCNPEELPTFGCAVGYEGRLCSRCSPNFYVENNKCAECWSQPVIISLFSSGIAVGAAYFVFLSLKQLHERNANGFIIMTRSILFYVQMTSVLLVSAPFRWPKKVLSLAIPYGWMQFKFGLLTCLQAGSAAAGSASDSLLFLGPFFVAAYCVICCVVIALHHFFSELLSSKSVGDALTLTRSKMSSTVVGFVYALVWGLNVLYTPITVSVLSKFVCSQDLSDLQYYEYHSPWKICSAFDTSVSVPIYALAISFYTVGIPLLYTVVILRYRTFKNANDIENCSRIRSFFGSIMQSYREEYYWWEVVAICRRFLICACAALLSPKVDALTLSIFVILSASLFAHLRSSPFVFPLNNTLESANLTMVMFNYLAGILFSSNLLDNFEGMDIFVVTVNVVAICLMLIAAIWVWKFAPELSQKLGISEQLLVPTVLSRLSHSISHRFSLVTKSSHEMQTVAPSPAGSSQVSPNDINLSTTAAVDGLPHRCELSLPQLPASPPIQTHTASSLIV